MHVCDRETYGWVWRVLHDRSGGMLEVMHDVADAPCTGMVMAQAMVLIRMVLHV